jgi:EmrB/QacA subfamily drug resistance transporter
LPRAAGASRAPARSGAKTKTVPRYVLTALIVACALFMENLDSTVISTSLPAIARDLNEDPIALKLALTSYLLSLAVFIPASGWAADRFGARTIFRAAIAVFTLGSILCGLSNELPQFVMARIVQGMGGAMMVPVGRLVLLRSVEKSEMVRALSYLTLPALLGPVVGPPVGGFITTYFHWRWIFWINVPIGVVGMVLASIFIENVRETTRTPLDITGFALSGAGLTATIFGLTVIGRGLMPLPGVLALIAVGGVLIVAYVRHARRVAHPILELRLLKVPTFRASVTGGTLFRIGIGAIPFLLPLMLQAGFGMNAFQSGAVTFISSAGAMIMKTTAPPILRAFGFRRVLLVDTVISAILLGSYGFFTPATPMVVIMGLLLVGGFFRSLEFTSLNAIAYADIDGPTMSRAVTFAAVAQQLAMSMGVALGAGVLQTLRASGEGTGFAPFDFKVAFLVTAVLSLTSLVAFVRLPANAGAGLANRRVVAPGGG